MLTQKEHDHFTVLEQIAVLLAATEGLLDDLDPDDIGEAEKTLRRMVRDDLPDLATDLAAGEPLSDERRARLIEAMRDALGQGGARWRRLRRFRKCWRRRATSSPSSAR